jgi:membrane protein
VTTSTAPESPARLDRGSWWAALKRTVREFKDDNLTDWAAALTYYAVLSIFPGMLVLVALLGLFGTSLDTLTDQVTTQAPGAVRQILTTALDGLRQAQGTAGVLSIVGLAAAIWSASNYVAAFMRASNAVYDVPEGRPLWKTLPIRIGVTLAVTVLLAVSAAIVVLTGSFADQVGRFLGLGSTLVTVWDIAKWPVLVLIVSQVLSLLYWASPNAKQAGVRWISPGGLVAILVWVLASIGFALYVANFASYNKTYGALGGVIVFLVWLWITNIAVLLGAELDAELHRARAIAAGHPAEEEPFMELRDTRKAPSQET